MESLKIGSRVRLKKDWGFAIRGMEGELKDIYTFFNLAVVEFDEEFSGGHICNGVTKPKRGHFIPDNLLEVIDQPLKVGDRVEVTIDQMWVSSGMKGTIIVPKENSTSGQSFGIEFEEWFDGGHTCNGRCEDGFGHFVNPRCLKRIEPEEVYETLADEVSLDRNYQTKGGREVVLNEIFEGSVFGRVKQDDGKWYPRIWNIYGKVSEKYTLLGDLVEVPQVVEFWVNIYKDGAGGDLFTLETHKSRGDAIKAIYPIDLRDYVKTEKVKITL